MLLWKNTRYLTFFKSVQVVQYIHNGTVMERSDSNWKNNPEYYVDSSITLTRLSRPQGMENLQSIKRLQGLILGLNE